MRSPPSRCCAAGKCGGVLDSPYDAGSSWLEHLLVCTGGVIMHGLLPVPDSVVPGFCAKGKQVTAAHACETHLAPAACSGPKQS